VVHIPTDAKPEKPKDQSLFNAGIAKLMRIDLLRQEAHMTRLSSNNVSWMHCCNAIRSEIWDFLTFDEKENLLKIEDEVINSLGNDVRENQMQQGRATSMQGYAKLDLYMRTLTDLEGKYGLSMPTMPKGASAMDL
jgi:hypothetical protein